MSRGPGIRQRELLEAVKDGEIIFIRDLTRAQMAEMRFRTFSEAVNKGCAISEAYQRAARMLHKKGLLTYYRRMARVIAPFNITRCAAVGPLKR